jgi:hypothetical protein
MFTYGFAVACGIRNPFDEKPSRDIAMATATEAASTALSPNRNQTRLARVDGQPACRATDLPTRCKSFSLPLPKPNSTARVEKQCEQKYNAHDKNNNSEHHNVHRHDPTE